MKEFFKKYSQMWVLLYVFIYFPWFLLLESRNSAECIIIQLEIDNWIPFCEYFIIPYVLWFFYVAAGVLYMLFCRPKAEFYRFITYFFGGLTVCLILYTFFFTGLNLRPEIDMDKNIFTRIVGLLYTADTSTNVCPSIHVFASIAIHMALYKAALYERHSVVFHASGVLALLIILSTVFLKQHSVLDVICALLLASIMHWLVYGTAKVPVTVKKPSFRFGQ